MDGSQKKINIVIGLLACFIFALFPILGQFLSFSTGVLIILVFLVLVIIVFAVYVFWGTKGNARQRLRMLPAVLFMAAMLPLNIIIIFSGLPWELIPLTIIETAIGLCLLIYWGTKTAAKGDVLATMPSTDPGLGAPSSMPVLAAAAYRYCPRCGASLGSASANQGEVPSINAYRYCMNCGAPLGVSNPNAGQAMSAYPNTPGQAGSPFQRPFALNRQEGLAQARQRQAILSIVCCVVAIVCLIFYYTFFTS